MKRKIPSCTDKSVIRKEDKDRNLVTIIKDSKIRHMTAEDMDIILENIPIGYMRGIVYFDGYSKRYAKGVYVPSKHVIVLDPQYDLNETLIHEAGHVFYGRFGAYEKNNVKWTEPLFKKPEYIKIAQKHILRTLPDEYHWEIKDLDKKNDGFIEGSYDWI